MRDVLANFVEPHDLNEERIELELLAKKKERTVRVWPGFLDDLDSDTLVWDSDF